MKCCDVYKVIIFYLLSLEYKFMFISFSGSAGRNYDRCRKSPWRAVDTFQPLYYIISISTSPSSYDKYLYPAPYRSSKCTHIIYMTHNTVEAFLFVGIILCGFH